ncbi:hypothetical protein [Sulfolobus acidocaldarius]|uniref:Conserved Archaeal protein n=4 Tax=Sulfolobus acidocaldarius TaxID=2285 RepID=Q4JA02_SULAC|nr:hypothetical protein [Sulfolobus acidocaldarius]AAY80388.1 conserved Archaeal protein [Sulfolobus acidocaldarius DSM 639]AGE70971.1 hypothetical protein SacN8_05000 [Sulfolobus acidocaldarius N8]AGE73242.1 hypothetical protein SacRon12I_04990 [Sulfolobus acidocaldarius Ron12/I]ALU28725.1 hypothetical protein ATY89_01305 [Sulfolobus acidocaldarius]ALU31444.1 hypothetical protein ATZ20_04340 [Sulfolobus acidocaldarius]
MIRFTVCKDFPSHIKNQVWQIASDVKRMTEFWRGIKELNVVKNGDFYEGSVHFAFPASGKIRIEIENSLVRLVYLSGPMKGTQEISINETKLCSNWNVKLNFPYLLFERWIRDHFEQGARNALKRIVDSVQDSS